MGFDIRIQPSKRFVIPKDSGYVPPNPDMKGYIRLSGEQMSLINTMMAVAGILDEGIQTPVMEKDCAKGKIPGYKFYFNDGEHVTRGEAASIFEALVRHETSSQKFFRAVSKRLRRPLTEPETKQLGELMALWIAFNKVAAANDGYIVH